MQSLYSNGFELIYDNMYQTFIDYKEEYQFYNNILNDYNKQNVLEIGSGTGNLAHYFLKHNFNYQGLDYSQDMINLAIKKNSIGQFIHADMKNFSLKKPVDSIIITGRTTSYLLSNHDVHAALNSFNLNLKKEGILCFDFIDASRFFKVIKGGKTFKHSANFNQIEYYRESVLNTNNSNNFMFDWWSRYYEVKNNNKKLIAEDTSEVRAFTKNEWELLLYLNDFKVLEIIDKPSYMFDCYAIVAQKKP
ncbi:class I SAM-dependent DNA methyltransferase [Olleya aquimaris]|uniref:Methyltransferase family protein n=1 Tax=Olleya aquimaris TaxID=639310 RepID=A0A327R8J3_9FLAO|nr:class I SAM-dependent methyltransferase [Olleya aquimaris]RAJ12004.1 methyltransferase family protein [Olleya aquimaris]